MKIRCKNCYKVLKPNEEYCTFCGEHSEQIAKAMETGNYGMNYVDKIKIALFIFCICAFIGSGIFMVLFAFFSNNATLSLYNRCNSLICSSIITLVVFLIVYRKDIKTMFWNGDIKQLYGAFLIGTLIIIIVILLSLIWRNFAIYPSYFVDYLKSGEQKFITFGKYSIFRMLASYLIIIFVEELVFRKLLIDALDNETMLGDKAIIILAGLIGTLGDFIWVMAPETILTSLIINVSMVCIYMYTNRSTLVNIIIRVCLLICVMLISIF